MQVLHTETPRKKYVLKYSRLPTNLEAMRQLSLSSFFMRVKQGNRT